MKKCVVNSDERKVYDANGNCRVETISRTVVHKLDDEDAFYMVFVDYVSWMFELKSITTIKVLNKLLSKSEFNTGLLDISTGLREQLMTELNLSRPAISKAINELVEKDVLRPCTLVNTDTGEVLKTLKGQYMVNPAMFWKGDLKKRKELKVTFTAEPEE